MEVMVSQMNDRIQKMEKSVIDLTTSLEFSQREIDELKSNNKALGKDNQAIKLQLDKLCNKLEASSVRLESLEERCNYQEDYSRRNNLRISGVEERSSGETWEQTAELVSCLLGDKLQLPDLVLERAHRVGQRQDVRPRTIVARFSRYCDREAVMRNARNLRGTNIFINDDLCAASQAVKTAQIPQLKQARSEGKIAFFRHTKLIVKERINSEDARRTDTSLSGETAVAERRQGTRTDVRPKTEPTAAPAVRVRDCTRPPAEDDGAASAAAAAAAAAAANTVVAAATANANAVVAAAADAAAGTSRRLPTTKASPLPQSQSTDNKKNLRRNLRK